jgi:hypothetical protein
VGLPDQFHCISLIFCKLFLSSGIILPKKFKIMGNCIKFEEFFSHVQDYLGILDS